MKLSVIVPVHNMEKYLENSINSILSGTSFDDTEIILLNNNSEDKSKEICLTYKNDYNNIKYFELHTDNRSEIYNRGLQEAAGEYVYFINGCDFLLDSFLTDAITYLDNNKNTNIFIRNCRLYNESGISCFNNYFQGNGLGPYLSMCVFRKSYIDILFKNELCYEIIFTGKLVFLDDSYFFDINNHNSFIKNEKYEYHDKFDTENDWYNYTITQISKYTKKFNVSYHVMDKCNKNCIACGHFSPLVSDTDTGVDLFTFEEDIKSILFLKQHIERFIITGGEPTLHNNLLDLLKIAKKYFGNVRLCSNGLNSNFFEQNKEFLNENNIETFVTVYNEESYNKIKDVLQHCGSYHISRLENGNGKRLFFNSKMLSMHKVNIDRKYNCYRGECVQLKHKKLYLCQYSANLEFLLNYYKNINFPFDENGTYIDLEKENDVERVLDFLYNAWPVLCEHCNEPYIYNGLSTNVVELTASKKELSEFCEE